jgi:hypothetical protein
MHTRAVIKLSTKPITMRLISTFFLICILFGCRKHDALENNQTNNPNLADSFYFKAKLNGKDVSWIVPSRKNEDSFDYKAGASNGYSDLSNECVEGYCYYMMTSTQIARNVPLVQPQINVSFNMATHQRSKDVILSWFEPGPKIYPTTQRVATTVDLLDPSKNGIVVYYLDENRKGWATNLGSQQGSSFESVSIVNETRTDVAHEKVWKAKFSCMLYDGLGNSIKVENAEIYGPIILH